jgi:hypothetical protein
LTLYIDFTVSNKLTDWLAHRYMNAFEPTLATCPWFPIVGNHEADDGDHYKHYEALAYGEPFGNGGAPFPTSEPPVAAGASYSNSSFFSKTCNGALRYILPLTNWLANSSSAQDWRGAAEE